MTFPLSPESPRHEAARQFGLLLRKTMARRQVGTKPLAVATGCAPSAIGCWRGGSNLPRLDTALRIAESLHEPALAKIVRDCRTGHCAVCGRSYLNEGGAPKRFCGQGCRHQNAQRSNPAKATTARSEALELLRSEVLRSGPVRKQAVGKALTLLTDEEEHSPGLIARRRLPIVTAAVEAMCRGCEPDGYCRIEDCPLRAVSPLIVAVGERDVDTAVKPEGPWGPSHREAQLTSIRAANAERWDRPGEREKARERMHVHHEAMTPEQRATQVRKLVAGQGRFRNRREEATA